MKENDRSDKRRRPSRATETPRAIVGGSALESLKRRAADLGLIIYRRGGVSPDAKGDKRRGGGGKP